ncbi:DNA cytosine methyltransferase [Candidatus Avelusimicrobium fimicolum]|uniref:DNA cytosine methyltransferase n=1 Tax=Candidatus Avelusimicrobium fimicolum TaxID=3416216 RepID=UPI003D0AA10A
MSRHTSTGVSLFTGAGGMDVGFEKAGIKVVFANEIMKEAASTYNANHPSGVMVNDDIHNVLSTLTKFKGADIVFGGPPCQGFSVAGKMDPNDERSKLIFTFLDAVQRIQPRAFVMENVKALGYLEKWNDVRTKYLKKAQSLGYHTVPFILNATEYGVAQKRERVFFIGIRNLYDEKIMRNLLNKEKTLAPSVRVLLSSLGKAGTNKNPHTCTAKITFATQPVMRKSPYAGMYFNGQGRPIDIDGYANTLPASMGGNKTPFFDEEYLYGKAKKDWVVGYHRGLVEGSIVPQFQEAPKRLRRITIKEAARIQTFPNDYIFSGNNGSIYTQIGNAVPCKMAEAVAKAVVKYLNKYDSSKK